MSGKVNSHYSIAQQPGKLKTWARKTADKLLKDSRGLMRNKGQKPLFLLYYCGMSGIALSTALASELNSRGPRCRVGMVYIRKENEKSHGYRMEVHGVMSNARNYALLPVFVDDFIESGDTFEWCRSVMASDEHYMTFHLKTLARIYNYTGIEENGPHFQTLFALTKILKARRLIMDNLLTGE
jgi:hypothetical protein